MNTSEKFRISPEIEKPTKKVSNVEIDEREEIKQKLKEPLPPLKKKKTGM